MTFFLLFFFFFLDEQRKTKTNPIRKRAEMQPTAAPLKLCEFFWFQISFLSMFSACQYVFRFIWFSASKTIERICSKCYLARPDAQCTKVENWLSEHLHTLGHTLSTQPYRNLNNNKTTTTTTTTTRTKKIEWERAAQQTNKDNQIKHDLNTNTSIEFI